MRTGSGALAIFAVVALLLASVGLYAVVAFAATQRRHEMGVRIAVGASTRDIVRLVVAEGMRPVVVGLALGTAGALGLSRLMRTLLFGVQPFEPSIVLAAVLAFSLAAAVACYLPARRATTQDALSALRRE